MTWGGGFTYGDLIKVAEENNISDCSCVNHIKRKKLLSEVYHGDDIRECKSCTLINARKLMTYPHKLSKLLDAELIDLSKPGESCQYVVRTTIDFFLERLDEDLSDYIVIPQFPNGLRFEYWNENIINRKDSISKDWQSYMIADSDNKVIVDFFGNTMYQFYNMTNSIMQLGSFLKENNIRYYLSTEGQGFQDFAKVNEIAKRRIEYIDTNYSILGGEINNSRLVGKEVPSKEVNIPRDGHYSEHGHTVAANNIYRLINDR